MKEDNRSGISSPQLLRALMDDDSADDVLLIIRTLRKGSANLARAVADACLRLFREKGYVL